MQSTPDVSLSPESENGQLLNDYLHVDTCDIAYIHTAGCYFGDAANPDLRVWMANISRARLEAVDSLSDAPSLAGSLAHLLFTAEEMATQNATPARTPGIKLLDDLRLNAIRGAYI